VVQASTGKFVLYDSSKGYAKDDISRFIVRHTNDKLLLTGTLAPFNTFAVDFMGQFVNGKTQEDVVKIAQYIDSLEVKAMAYESSEQRVRAAYYLEVMKTIMWKGITIIPAELKRLQELLDDNETADKVEMRVRRHIWEQFYVDSRNQKVEDIQYYDMH
jgi:hypothetical protein